MVPIRIAALGLLLVAGGCAVTPLQQCQAPYRAELRNVKADLHATRIALARGYRLVPARNEIGLHFCLRPSGMAVLCRAEDGEPMYDKQPIVRRAEQAKLRALAGERARLESALVDCTRRYPAEAGGEG